MAPNEFSTWTADWAWGLPLIVVTVVFHTYGLSRIHKRATERLKRNTNSAILIGTTALWATFLHAVEVISWAVAYWFLGAVPGYKLAMLYSLNAMTSYGHESATLAAEWRLMGALEALNGWILFGLTTAFLFTVLQKAWLRAET